MTYDLGIVPLILSNVFTDRAILGHIRTNFKFIKIKIETSDHLIIYLHANDAQFGCQSLLSINELEASRKASDKTDDRFFCDEHSPLGYQ